MIISRGKLHWTTENTRVSIYPACLVGCLLTHGVHRVLGVDYPSMLCIFRNGNNRWANNLDVSNLLSLATIAKIRSHRRFVDTMYVAYTQHALRLARFIPRLLAASKEDTLQMIARHYHTFNRFFTDAYCYGWLPLGTEGLASNFSGLLVAFLVDRIENRRLSISVGECFSALTASTSLTVRDREQLDLHKILRWWKQKSSEGEQQNKRLMIKLRRHYALYRWMSFDYEGPELPFVYFQSRFFDLVRSKQSPDVIVKHIRQRIREVRDRRKKLWNILELKSAPEYAYLFRIAQRFGDWKSEQQELFFQSYYAIDYLFDCLAQKVGIKKELLRYIFPEEMDVFIKRRRPSIAILAKRRRHCVVIYKKGLARCFIGSDADATVTLHVAPDEVLSKSSLRGQVAYPGKVEGIVKIVNAPRDMRKMRNGNILVSSKTNPNLLIAMRCAAAIVTDYGGLTSHAAILARELHTPTIVGTRYATKVLRDGMRVVVDAHNGIVRRLRPLPPRNATRMIQNQ